MKADTAWQCQFGTKLLTSKSCSAKKWYKHCNPICRIPWQSLADSLLEQNPPACPLLARAWRPEDYYSVSSPSRYPSTCPRSTKPPSPTPPAHQSSTRAPLHNGDRRHGGNLSHGGRRDERHPAADRPSRHERHRRRQPSGDRRHGGNLSHCGCRDERAPPGDGADSYLARALRKAM